MQLRILYFLFAKELVDNVLANVQSFWLQFEFSVHINDPLQQKSSLGVFDFRLNLAQIIWWVNFVLFFLDQQILEDVLSKFRHVLRITVIKLVRKGHRFQLSFFLGSASLLENVLNILCVICFFWFVNDIWPLFCFRLSMNISDLTFHLVECFVLIVLSFLRSYGVLVTWLIIGLDFDTYRWYLYLFHSFVLWECNFIFFINFRGFYFFNGLFIIRHAKFSKTFSSRVRFRHVSSCANFEWVRFGQNLVVHVLAL